MEKKYILAESLFRRKNRSAYTLYEQEDITADELRKIGRDVLGDNLTREEAEVLLKLLG